MRAKVFLDAAYAIALSVPKDRYHGRAILLADEKVIPLSKDLYTRAFRLYGNRPDKEWGLTDCVSFVIMQDRKITEALTPDEHFEQAGFRAMLLESSR